MRRSQLNSKSEATPWIHRTRLDSINEQCYGHGDKSTDINFQGLSDYENSATRTPPTSAFDLFYSARSHEQLDLFYLSPFAKLQNPPEGKVSELFRSKVGDFPLANLRGNRPNLH